MPYADLHTHTHLSFDSDADLRENCLAARAAGMDAIAVTNHFDFDGILDGIYPPYFPHLDREEIDALAPAFAPDLQILRGIEMGQPHVYPQLVPRLLQTHRFDYVLASVHNLERTPDFCFLRYEHMTTEHCCQLLTRYFKEVAQVARIPGIHTLAHLTYPIRYMKRAGKQIDLLRFEPAIRSIFHILVENGVNLEINTSGLRQGMDETMPSLSIAALYRDCGGKRIAVGSDAHDAASIGADVIATTDRLRDMGFEVFCP